MKTLTQLLLATVLTLTLTTSVIAQETDSLREDTTTIRISLDDYKYIQAWAEYGVTCDSIVQDLTKQIEKDAARTVEMAEEIDKLKKQNKRLSFGYLPMGVAILGETLILIFRK